ncbi:MAG TPA: hypothetical protein VIL74_08395 [Pyrinomonadaceae bacterium]
MFKTICRAFEDMLRRRRLNRIRREFARSGYPVDHLEDSRIETAMIGGSGLRRVEDVFLTPKTIYFALRRLSTDRGGAGDLHSPGRKARRGGRSQMPRA